MHATDSRPARAVARLALASARRPRTVVAAWILLAVALLSSAIGFGRPTSEDVSLPGSDAQIVRDLTAAHPVSGAGGSGAAGLIVVHTETGRLDAGAPAAAVSAAVDALKAHDRVAGARPPSTQAGSLSPDGRTGWIAVDLTTSERGLSAKAAADITDTARQAAGSAVEVMPGGSLTRAGGRSTGHAAELLGLVVALLVLGLALRSVLAAALPPLVAVLTLTVSVTTIGLLGHATDIPAVATTLATMIGLGVGIDYGLFLLTRLRTALGRGASVPDAVAEAAATSGTAVAWAGGTVIVALGGLAVAGVPVLVTLAWTTGISVVVAVAGALTLLPALMAWCGRRLAPRSTEAGAGADASAAAAADATPNANMAASAAGGHPTSPEGTHPTSADGEPTPSARSARRPRWSWARQADLVTARPWRSLAASVLVLGALAWPATALTLGQTDAGDDPASSQARQAYDTLATAFGPGVNGPLTVVVPLSPAATPTNGTAPDPRAAAVADALRGAPGVARVGQPQVSADGQLLRLSVTPTTAPSDPATVDLVHRLRELRPDGLTVHVGNPVAARADLAAELADRAPWVIATVLLLSMGLLLAAFGAPVVAAKAALMNLVSIGAAYGVLTWVVQEGHLSGLVGLDGPVPIESYVPLMLFALLFGLSMDYEVFLLSSVRESWLSGRWVASPGDRSRGSVRDGLASTGRVITSAATIMVCVFALFVLRGDPVVTTFGLGMAVAIAVDATIVRGVLVPATMVLLGAANWWTPFSGRDRRPRGGGRRPARRSAELPEPERASSR